MRFTTLVILFTTNIAAATLLGGAQEESLPPIALSQLELSKRNNYSPETSPPYTDLPTLTQTPSAAEKISEEFLQSLTAAQVTQTMRLIHAAEKQDFTDAGAVDRTAERLVVQLNVRLGFCLADMDKDPRRPHMSSQQAFAAQGKFLRFRGYLELRAFAKFFVEFGAEFATEHGVRESG